MNQLIRISLTAIAAIALLGAPVSAQSRGGHAGSSSSRGSSMSHSGGGSHYSGGGSMSRSGGSHYSGGSSMSRSSGSYSSSRSYSSSPQTRSSAGRSSSSQQRSYSSAPQQRSSSSRTSGSYSSQQRSSSGSISRQSGATRPSTSSGRAVGSSSSRVSSSNGAGTRPATRVNPNTSGNNSSSNVRPGTVTRGGSSTIRNNGAVSNGGRSVRPQAGQRTNFAGGVTPQEVRMRNENGVNRIPPRDRHPLPYNRPSHFWHHGPHYFGYRIDYLPRYVIHHYWGRPYYFCDGLWYRYYIDHYYVCRPPFGYIFVPDVVDIVYTACRIAYYNQALNTYRTIDENAQTIAEQNRIIAENNALIAQQNADIAFNSEKAQAAYETANNLGLVQAYADASTEYYYDDGVFFTKGADGQYTVIVPPAGAQVNELPDDYDTITLDGKEYYKVDDTIYEIVIVDGTACFQVLGQLTGELATKFDLSK